MDDRMDAWTTTSTGSTGSTTSTGPSTARRGRGTGARGASRTASWARDHLVVLVQPGGEFAVWSTGARTLVLRDATEQEVTDHLVARSLTEDANGPDGGVRAERRALDAARWAVGRARQGLQPRIQLPRWEDAAATGPGTRARS